MTNRESLRPLPKNREAEQVVLGAALLEPEAVVPVLLESLAPSDFYWKPNQLIYRTALELFEKGQPPDVVVVANRLEELGHLRGIGGRTYLSELVGRVTTTASVEYYADIVKKKAVLRRLVEAGMAVSELGFDEEANLPDLLDRAESQIFGISRLGAKPQYIRMADGLEAHVAQLEQINRSPGATTGLATGIRRYDELTSGLHPSDLTILAGRPSLGKSALAVTIALHIAKGGTAVGFFSLEMSKDQVFERFLAAEGRVNLHALRSGHLGSNNGAWNRINEAVKRLKGCDVIIDDTPSISVVELKARARRMKAEYDIKLLLVDYLQLIEAGHRADLREQEVAYVARSLKALAREMEIPVIAVSQLSRESARGEGRRPRLSDLRSSGEIEQVADIVAFLYTERREEDDNSPTREMEWILAKQRNGPTGVLSLLFHREYVTFFNPTGEEPLGGEEDFPF